MERGTSVTFLVRVLFYIQLLLGLGRFAGLVRSERIWETHVIIGALVALLALVALRPRPGMPKPALRTAARLTPLLPLLTGLAIFTGITGGRPFTLLHMALAVVALGLVEMAAASERKGAGGGGSPERTEKPWAAHRARGA